MSQGPSLHVVAPIARGGMGEVHLAFRRGESFRRMLALKRLHGALADDQDARSRLLSEARYAAQIRHPNVVEVIDVGDDEQGVYLLMDYVRGLSLRELVSKLDGPLPLQLSLRIGLGIARALRAAHELEDDEGQPMGLIHRDVSPSNVLVGFDGTVRLTDFGLAKAERDPRTQELLRGTSGYIPPEQLRFEVVDSRADLFAFGVVLFELLCGCRLYGDDDVRVAARRVLSEEPPDLRRVVPEVSDAIAELVRGLLDKSPAKRPQSAELVARALEREIRARVMQEGLLDLRAFLEQKLSSEIQAQREWLARHWDVVETTSMRPPEVVAASLPPNPPKGRFAGFALVAVLVAAGLSAWLIFQSSEPTEVGDPSTPDPAPVSAPAPAPAAIAVPLAEPDAGSMASSGEPVTTRRRRARRRRHPSRQRAKTPSKMGDCLLGWSGECQ